MELGWPLPKRKRYLKELESQTSSKTHPVPFQGRTQYLPVRDIPLGLPLYRLENGRTTGRQAEYLAARPALPDDFFRADNELQTAQKAQHDILTKLARGPKNLFKEFDKGEQSEPIILSSTGSVINGNRRLSTWRELYESEPKKHRRFQTIEAVILPYCDDRDLDRLEADLQLKEDLKAEYSWTSTALMMREKRERFRYKDNELASIYGFTKKSLQELFDCIDYADQYLDSRDLHRRYPEVDDKEYPPRPENASRHQKHIPWFLRGTEFGSGGASVMWLRIQKREEAIRNCQKQSAKRCSRCCRRGYGCEWQNQFERIVQEAHCAESLVPLCRACILCIDCQCHTPNFGGDGNSAETGRE